MSSDSSVYTQKTIAPRLCNDGEDREIQIDYFFRSSPSLDFGRFDCARKEEAY